MERLKQLLESSSDNEILSYLKDDFRKKIDDYIYIIKEAPKLQKAVIELRCDSIDRQLVLERYQRKLENALADIQKNK